MTTESVRKAIRVGSTLLVGIAISVSVWFFLQEHKTMELQSPNQEIAVTENQISVQLSQLPDAESLTKAERGARQSRKILTSLWSEEQLANPHFQKVLEVMDSPEYAELPISHSTHEWKDFLESKGVPVTRGNPGLFTGRPPFMSLADYEPMVRHRIAQSFLAQDPVDMTDPEAATLQRAKVLTELDDADENGLSWFMERFGDDWKETFRVHEGMENNPAVIWMTDIQQNAERIVEDVKQARVDALEASVPSWDMSSVMESSKAPDSETEVPATRHHHEHAPMTDAEIEAATEKLLTPQRGKALPNKRPDTPSEIQSNLENNLKAQFSSERFERAMSTLERHGPEEGLRHLRENDPEVAKQIEQHRKREEVSQ